MADQIIKEGDIIVFDELYGDRQSIITLRGKARVKLGKAYYPADPIIGSAYGTLFTISEDGKSLVKTHHSPSDEWNAEVEVTRNNSKLLDANHTNQALHMNDILAMKQAGKAGQEIIDALTSNSATFQTKNEFAQEKYKKKKARKYVHVACAKRPTTASICDTLFNKQPSRIGYLRPDALGILLHMANVGPGAKTLVLENCGGLITGAVAERMGGHGSVCSTYLEPHPKGIETVKSFNFSAEIMETIYRAPLVALLQTRREQLQREKEEKEAQGEKKGVDGGNVEAADPMPIDAPTTVDTNTSNVAELTDKNSDGNTATTDNNNKEKEAAATAGGNGSNKTTTPSNPPFSGCILCNPILHPKTALQALLPLLAPSASFAVWSRQLQPLAEALDELRTAGTAVNLMVQETWYRKQQVLPKRTHPLMSMNHGGGYLLSGIVTVTGTQIPLALPLPPTAS